MYLQKIPQSNITLDIVLPVYNEEKILYKSVLILLDFLKKKCNIKWQISIADNGSTDNTPVIGKQLARKYDEVEYISLPFKGRGRALRTVWLNSKADILSYMDIDLSTDLNCFMPMIEPLIEGQADIAIGSRFKAQAKVKRGLKREILSRGYITLIKLFFNCTFTDAQCGFKAITRSAASVLIPRIKNQNWFFDAELLLLADHYGFRIFEVPVHWVDDPDSRVKILRTVKEHFGGLVRMRLSLNPLKLTGSPDLIPVDAHA